MTDLAERLRRELGRAQAVISVQRAINAVSRDPARVMDIVAATSQRLSGGTGAVVELLVDDHLIYRTAVGAAAGRVGTKVPIKGSLSGTCVRTQQALRCDDADDDPRVDREACRAVGLRSMVVVPLLTSGRCLGVLKVLSDQPSAFTDQTVQTLETLADFIAQSLDHANDFADRDRDATHDTLTGLLNRRGLLERLEELDARAGTPAKVTAFFLDLDGFKDVNDHRGHGGGDLILKAVAKHLKSELRPDDLLARAGGDEFIVICPGLASHERPSLTRRLRSAVLEAAEHVGVDVSIGAADRLSGESINDLLNRADAAMYTKKRARQTVAGRFPR